MIISDITALPSEEEPPAEKALPADYLTRGKVDMQIAAIQGRR